MVMRGLGLFCSCLQSLHCSWRPSCFSLNVSVWASPKYNCSHFNISNFQKTNFKLKWKLKVYLKLTGAFFVFCFCHTGQNHGFSSSFFFFYISILIGDNTKSEYQERKETWSWRVGLVFKMHIYFKAQKCWVCPHVLLYRWKPCLLSLVVNGLAGLQSISAWAMLMTLLAWFLFFWLCFVF